MVGFHVVCWKSGIFSVNIPNYVMLTNSEIFWCGKKMIVLFISQETLSTLSYISDSFPLFSYFQAKNVTCSSLTYYHLAGADTTILKMGRGSTFKCIDLQNKGGFQPPDPLWIHHCLSYMKWSQQESHCFMSKDWWKWHWHPTSSDINEQWILFFHEKSFKYFIEHNRDSP